MSRKEFYYWIDQYDQHFEDPYSGLGYWNIKTDEEVIEEIKHCLETGTPQEIPVELFEDVDF